MTYEEILELEDFCLDKDIDIVIDFLKKHYEAKYRDEWIDDGGDVRGTYVMGQCYELPNGKIDLFYLNTEGVVSYIDTKDLAWEGE